MTCLICRGSELVEAPTTVTFVRGEIRLAIRGVPAHLCPKCKDAVVAEDIAVRLLRAANEMSEAGLIESTQDFQNLLA